MTCSLKFRLTLIIGELLPLVWSLQSPMLRTMMFSYMLVMEDALCVRVWSLTVITVCRTRKSLKDVISHWTPSVSSVQKARVLLVGAVGAGKSSFFNSLNSVFKGHVSFRANTGIAGTSLTTQVTL